MSFYLESYSCAEPEDERVMVRLVVEADGRRWHATVSSRAHARACLPILRALVAEPWISPRWRDL